MASVSDFYLQKMPISGYHPNWQRARLELMMKLVPPEYFKEKNILELGAFHGYFGNYFQSVLGSNMTLIEGRQENLDEIKTNYPELNAILGDLDVPDWSYGKFDVIINFGLYYHLEKHHRENLINCIDNCDLMFFETVIYDSIEPELFYREEFGIDQSMSNRAGIPSTSYIENIFEEKNCAYVKINDPLLDQDSHCYTWPDIDARVDSWVKRRFWLVKPNKSKRKSK